MKKVEIKVRTKDGKEITTEREVTPFGTISLGYGIFPIREAETWIKTMYSEAEEITVKMIEERKKMTKQEFIKNIQRIIEEWNKKKIGEYYFEGEVRNEAAWIFAGKDFKSVETYLITLQFDNEKYEIEVAAEKAIDGPHQEIWKIIKENDIRYIINRF